MRYLGIDLGDARTGLALSDPFGITCTPLEVIEEHDVAVLVQKVLIRAQETGADAIIVGVPRPLRGGTNHQAQKSLSFAKALSDSCTLPVTTWDERFTTKMASKKGTSHAEDAVAACYMLQNYLDAQAYASKTQTRKSSET